MAVIVLLGVTSMALALSALLLSTANQLFTAQAEAALQRQNQSVATAINDLTAKASADLLLARQNPAFNQYYLASDDATRQAALAQIQTAILYLQERFAIDEICVITNLGREIARCVQGTLAGVDELSPDETRNPFFLPTLASADGEVYRSPTPYVSPDTHRWVVAHATPIILPDGTHAGVFHFEIPLVWFEAKVNTNSLEDGYSFLLTQQGRLLVHPQLEQFRQAAGLETVNPAQAPFPPATALGSAEFQQLVERMTAGGPGQGEYRDGAETFAVVYQPVFDGHWVVATVLPHSVIDARAADLLRRTLLVATPLLVLALGLMLWYADRLVQPIQLTARALRSLVTAGADHHRPLPISSQDEIGELSLAFSQMSAELDQHNRQMLLLNQMNAKLQACHTPQEAYALVPPLLQQLFPDEAGALYWMNASHTLVERVASWRLGLSGDRVWRPEACSALRHGSVHVVDVTSGGGFPPPADPAQFCGHVEPPYPPASLCVPLLAQEEELGLLHLRSLFPVMTSEEFTPPAAPPPMTLAKQQLAQTVADSLAWALANLHLQATLREHALRDALTGLFNRRYLEATLEREFKRVTRGLRPLGLIMLDLDNFKRLNDTFGHLAGDAVLKALGALLLSRVRGEDIACRYGGEEFALVMPEAPLDVTRARAEQLRESIQQLVISYEGRALGPITVSVGVAAFPEHGRTREVVLRAADQALYRAKAEGRDRVVVAGQ